jgi:hypothetical protein
MRALIIAAAVIGLVAARAEVGFSQANAATTPSLEGVWQATSVITTGPNAANSIPDRPFNINVWTKKYFSRITADGPARPVLPPARDPARLTDAEKLARYEHFRQFVPAAGLYEIKGTQFFAQPLVARDQTADIVARNAGKPAPGAPAGQQITFERDQLVLTQTTADGKNVNRRTYTRLDRAPVAGTKPHPIEGVWRAISSVATGANASSNPNRQPNIFIYKNGYYSNVAQDGNAPLPARPILAPAADPARLTDAEKLARYEHWAPGVAQAGRYEVKGTTLYQYLLLAKNQSADIIERHKTGNMGTVAPNSELVFSNENNTMVQIVKSADGKTVTRRTYTRLE